jgi:hypothetical protein
MKSAERSATWLKNRDNQGVHDPPHGAIVYNGDPVVCNLILAGQSLGLNVVVYRFCMMASVANGNGGVHVRGDK